MAALEQIPKNQSTCFDASPKSAPAVGIPWNQQHSWDSPSLPANPPARRSDRRGRGHFKKTESIAVHSIKSPMNQPSGRPTDPIREQLRHGGRHPR